MQRLRLSQVLQALDVWRQAGFQFLEEKKYIKILGKRILLLKYISIAVFSRGGVVLLVDHARFLGVLLNGEMKSLINLRKLPL